MERVIRLFSLSSSLTNKILVVRHLLSQQCEFVAAYRIRRCLQVLFLYRSLYSERCFSKMVLGLVNRYAMRCRPASALLTAVGCFCWEQERITDDELRQCVADLQYLNGASNLQRHKSSSGEADFESYNLAETQRVPSHDDNWQLTVDTGNMKLYRRPIAGSYLYEYRVCGTFLDIPAEAFFQVQIDTQYRKQWDRLVLELDIVDSDKNTGCEVVHWVMSYPFPMYKRDYVYIRKYMVDEDANVMVLVSKSTDHPNTPELPDCVRVKKYLSRMVIRPHRTFCTNGFDYVLTYFDDPEAAFSSVAYNWMATSGVPDFILKLHKAAQMLCPSKHASDVTSEAPLHQTSREQSSENRRKSPQQVFRSHCTPSTADIYTHLLGSS